MTRLNEDNPPLGFKELLTCVEVTNDQSVQFIDTAADDLLAKILIAIKKHRRDGVLKLTVSFEYDKDYDTVNLRGKIEATIPAPVPHKRTLHLSRKGQLLWEDENQNPLPFDSNAEKIKSVK